MELWRLVTPERDLKLFDKIPMVLAKNETSTLARYRPENGGSVEIGQNFRQYRRDYIYLSSDLDMAYKPNFDEYMAVLITLSLANESAHIIQNNEKSLDDFYAFLKLAENDKACALYALQQHVSDVVMLDYAMRIERLFLGQGSVKGLNALRLALEKNDLRDEFEDFRQSINQKNKIALQKSLTIIKKKRIHANLADLKFCPQSGNIFLPYKIIKRAVYPARNILE